MLGGLFLHTVRKAPAGALGAAACAPASFPPGPLADACRRAAADGAATASLAAGGLGGIGNDAVFNPRRRVYGSGYDAKKSNKNKKKLMEKIRSKGSRAGWSRAPFFVGLRVSRQRLRHPPLPATPPSRSSCLPTLPCPFFTSSPDPLYAPASSLVALLHLPNMLVVHSPPRATSVRTCPRSATCGPRARNRGS